MAIPPNHKVDHVPTYILTFDDAWDMERLDYEVAVMKGEQERGLDKPEVPWASADDHPWIRYTLGLSRGDLATVSHYLRPDAEPLTFELRRLSFKQWTVIENRRSTNSIDAGNLTIQHSLVKIEGADILLERGGTETGSLTDADMTRLRTLVGDVGLVELRRVTRAVSQELLEVEKKP